MGTEAKAPLTVIFKSPTQSILPYSVELSGTFNQWQLNGTSKMKWQEIEKKYLATIANDEVDIYFNLYKNGDWQNPIATEFGKPFTCGFIVDPVKESSFEPEFYGWAKESKIIPPRTVVGNLVTIEDFSMTLLGRHGEVYVYLPENYQQELDKHYPVAYMLDGQNLFSESLSYSYEWKVDEALTALGMEVIVVGISNGPERWQEYNPWDSVNYMGNSVVGSGKQTIQFIKEQLIPYIDGNFRTLKGAENTALIGSSLGGLMALYAGLEHSDTFAKVAAFSPSFSFATLEGQQSLAPEQSNLIKATKQADSNHKAKFYFDVGEVEYGSFTLIDALADAFLQAGYSSAQLQVVKDNKGRHCELDWSRRFPGAITWLFAGEDGLALFDSPSELI